MSLKPILKADSVDAVRMSDGRLFHAAGPATENARLPRRSLVRGMTRSPRAAERRAPRVDNSHRQSNVQQFIDSTYNNLWTYCGYRHRAENVRILKCRAASVHGMTLRGVIPLILRFFHRIRLLSWPITSQWLKTDRYNCLLYTSDAADE